LTIQHQNDFQDASLTNTILNIRDPINKINITIAGIIGFAKNNIRMAKK